LIAYYVLTGSATLTTVFMTTFIQNTTKPNFKKRPQAPTLGSSDVKYFYYAWLLSNNPSPLSTPQTNPLVGNSKTNNLNFNLTTTQHCFKVLLALKQFHTQSFSAKDQTSPNFTPFYLFEGGLNFPVGRYGTSQPFLEQRGVWSHVHTLSAKTRNTLPVGVFYQTQLPLLSYKQLLSQGAGLWAIDGALQLHERSLKTLRFLYNYSTLHRSFLQGTHRLTTVKKLLFGTFYDRKAFTNNL